MSRILTAATLCLLVAAVVPFAISQPAVRASNASEQIIFSDSGTGFGNSSYTPTTGGLLMQPAPEPVSEIARPEFTVHTQGLASLARIGAS